MENTPFNWHDYLVLDPAFGKDLPVIAQALDTLAAAEPDGPALIRKAVAMHPAQTHLTVRPLPFHFSLVSVHAGEARPDTGTIFLDLKAISTTSVRVGKKDMHRSITGVLVHELFHDADFRSNDLLNPGMAAQFLNVDHLPPEQQTRVRAAMPAILKAHLKPYGLDSLPDQLPADFFHHIPAMLTEIAAAAHVPDGSFTLPIFENPKSYKKKIDRAFYSDRQTEDDAVAYTDEFMAKYFPDEPLIQVYNNFTKLLEPKLFAATLGCGTAVVDQFKPQTISYEALGQFTQPSISAEPNRLCKTDVPKR